MHSIRGHGYRVGQAIQTVSQREGVGNGIFEWSAAGPAEVKFIQRVLTPRTASTLLVLALPFAAALAILGGFWYLRAKSHAAPRQ